VTLVAAIDDALRLSERRSQISAVHDVVRNGLREIAPEVAIRATDYFTHSFVPDLILEWGPEDRRRTRHVHLRFVVSDATFLHELDYLASTEPVILGLLDSGPLAEAPADGDGTTHAGTLVTQSQSIDALREGKERDQRTVSATRELVRGGRGSLGRDRATEIVGAYHDTLNAIETLATEHDNAAAQTSALLVALQEILQVRHFHSVERDLRSRWIRQGGDPFDFPGATEWDPQTLSHTELGEVLNALLDSPREVPTDVWARNAWFLSSQELAEALGDRRGGALNKLAATLLPNWTAQWVWAQTLELPLQPTLDWLITDRTLAVEIGDMRAAFRDDGRRFKDKKPTDAPLPTIADMETVLSDPHVRAANFRSASEDIAYSYRATTDKTIYGRLGELLEDTHRRSLRVSDIHMLVPGRDDVAEIDLDRQVIDLDKTPTPISVLIRLALSYFHHASYDEATIEQFLRTGDVPETDSSIENSGEAA
jgi:hypothetical protein